MSQPVPTTPTTPSVPVGNVPVLAPGNLTLREAADALGSSSTALRKMIRQGRLPEAQEVKTFEGRMWAVAIEAIPGIAERLGLDISVVDAVDLREPETAEMASDRRENPASEAAPVNDEPGLGRSGTAIETAGREAAVGIDVDALPELTLADVLDTALLERLLGAKRPRRRRW